ncbi:MAG: serine hydrolase [Actinomycetia bacterium]|nr:serine hydrolase [Actinomycetes bacterium]
MPVVRAGSAVLGGAGAFRAPLLHDPGERFTYGINTDWLGKVLEAVTGKGLDVLIKENVTGPLGMHDTMFLLDDRRRADCVSVHVPGEGGGWASAGEHLGVLHQAGILDREKRARPSATPSPIRPCSTSANSSAGGSAPRSPSSTTA